MLNAGTATLSITPSLGSEIAGLFERRLAADVVDDLHVRALVLDNGSIRLALVLLDLICFPAALVRTARERIASRCGIPAGRVMISCTHTHTGPPTVALLGATPDPDYLATLPERIAGAVALAVARLVPARIAIGTMPVDNVCFNRRFRMTDGTVVFNPGVGNPEIVATVGPTDPDVTAILVETVEGVPIALWSNLSLHYVGTDSDLAYSADYYGAYAREVSRLLGDGCLGMLTNGTSGDINNVDVRPQSGRVTASVRAQRVASAVANAAIAATMMQKRHSDVALAGTSEPITVSRREVPTCDSDLARSVLAGEPSALEQAARGFSFAVGQPIPQYQVETYAREVTLVAEMPKTIVSEVQVLRFGDIGLVALPGEIFAAVGLAIKAQSPFTTTAVIGLANDYIGYVPTGEAFTQGGYETWTARSAWAAPATAPQLVETSLAMLRDREVTS